ncbi:cobalamin B12-binding domain-containing protein [Alkalihalophilus marmarensis]|uniref:cobalamin B12-binding domain-containing protein n=1 Tax=Alkalihalophilus marmarensis TaxID=521377 RepID=UPI002DBDCD8F|nr:cobalamin-dependent protein [Alkalihalophilus marmarensis]MEC2073308.1 cobalamin-dependent protein [Alkalihalophilus marmarensis]
MHKMLESFKEAILQGDQHRAWEIVLKAEQTYKDNIHIYEDLITAAMREIGRSWESNDLTVADEHLATSTIDFIMTYYHSKKSKNYQSCQHKAMFLCPEGEHHDIGITMVSHLFEDFGWSTKLLGPNVPCADAVQFAKQWKPDVISISITLTYNLAQIENYIKELNQSGLTPVMMIGGRLVTTYQLSSFITEQTLLFDDVEELKRWLRRHSKGAWQGVTSKAYHSSLFSDRSTV